VIPLAALFLLFAKSEGCIPAREAIKHVDENVCVAGKVFAVAESKRPGVYYLDFCGDTEDCSFTAIVFTRDIEPMGDLKQLEGTTVRVYGRITSSNDHAAMVITDQKQFSGFIAPPLSPPDEFDAENRGHASPGTSYLPKPKKGSRKKKKQKPVIPAAIPQ